LFFLNHVTLFYFSSIRLLLYNFCADLKDFNPRLAKVIWLAGGSPLHCHGNGCSIRGLALSLPLRQGASIVSFLLEQSSSWRPRLYCYFACIIISVGALAVSGSPSPLGSQWLDPAPS